MALTAQQLVALATQAADAPGWVTQTGQLLNLILSDIAETYDFDVARGTAVINLTGNSGFGPYQLPADYLRADFNEVFFTIDLVPYTVIAIDLDQMDALPQQPGNTAYPEYYATDMSTSPPSLFLWPEPQGSFPLTVRYRRQMPDIATPETSSLIPWFPNQAYLLARLTGELMKLTDDERAKDFLGDGPDGAQGIMQRYLRLKDDKSSRTATVKLDKRRFGSNYNTLPGTKLIGPL